MVKHPQLPPANVPWSNTASHMRLSLCLITALMQSDSLYLHMHTQHPRLFANTSESLFIPPPTSFTHVSPTLQVCKVNIRDEQDRLSV